MKLRLRYFASLRESLGKSHEDISTDAQTVGQLRDQLLAQGGAYLCLARGKAVRMALNQVMVEEDAAITDNAELAFFPPVTGG
jgi:molybdopterin synthase sulfur carrier subunit